MLVLSRKKNEAIVINNDITVVIVEIRGDKVRLGIEAPAEVPVHRKEVWDAIQRETRNAKTTSGGAGGSGISTCEQPGTGQGGVEATTPVHEVGKEEGS